MSIFPPYMSVAMVWQGREAYSIKAVAKSRVDTGPIFEKMAQQLDKMNMTLVARWVFEAKEVWDESASKNAGSKVICWNRQKADASRG